MKTLYKRNTNGSVQEWTIEVDGSKYRTIYGQSGGALITSEWTECFPKNVGKKNETSSAQQAVLEAESLIKQMLEKQHYFSSMNDIDKENFVKPMLAKKWEDYKHKIIYPVYSDPKLDGHRGVFSVLGLQTRVGKDIISVPHVISPLYNLLYRYPDIVLDGELYNHSLRYKLNQIASLVRKQKPTSSDLQESQKLIQYWVFDGWGFEGITKHTPFAERKEALWSILKGLDSSIIMVKSKKLDDEAGVDWHYNRLVQDQFEGQIIRWGECKYENKRTNTLLKRKDFHDEEFEVVGFEEGKGKAAGRAYSVICKLNKPATDGDTTFKAGMNFSDSELKNMWENQQEFIGQKANIRFLNYSEYGKPIIPKMTHFREDI